MKLTRDLIHRRKRTLAGSLGAMLVALSLMMPVGAPIVQAQATPEAGMLDVPSPQECQIAPRSFPLFPAGVGQRAAATPLPLATPPATSFVPPQGEAADAETVAAVTATVREAIACRNGNDFLRAYALFTENMIVSLFGGPATIDPEVGQIDRRAAGTPAATAARRARGHLGRRPPAGRPGWGGRRHADRQADLP